MDHRIHQTTSNQLLFPRVKRPATKQPQEISFKGILADVQSVKISKHAKQRLTERNITISENEWQQITHKMHEAKQKGVTDSLVLTNEAALLVSTKNSTVVTAMNRDEASSRIFTNINGAILINE